MADAIRITFAIVCLARLLPVTVGQCSLQTATPRFRRAIFDFSSKLIERVAYEEQYHFVVSPLSIWTILSVAAEGAEGETYEELRQVLRLSKMSCFKRKFYKLVRSLIVQNSDVTIERSGIIAAKRRHRVKKRFQTFVKNKLAVAEVMALDFSKYNASTMAVNRYVSEETHGKIKEVIYPEDFNNEVMLLIDSVYFKGQWRYPFNPSRTLLSTFYDEGGLEIGQVNLMAMDAGSFNVTNMKIVRARVLELPYGTDGRYSMLLFLPNRNVKLLDVINRINKISLMAIFKKFAREGPLNVEVSIPRFTTTSELDTLKDLIIDMGAELLFDEDRADFSRIAYRKLFVNRLLQKACIDVTEEGTEASSEIPGFISSPSHPDSFKVDKPFFYLIVERYTQSVLFAGAYSNPSEY